VADRTANAMRFIHLARFFTRCFSFGLLSTSRSAARESGLPLFLREIWPPANHDPRRPSATVCRTASKARSKWGTHGARFGSYGGGFPASYAQCLAWKAWFFFANYRRYDAPIAGGRTRPDRAQRMDRRGQANLKGDNVLKLGSGGQPFWAELERQRKSPAVD
jgi:hypothetical protein